MSSTVRPQIAIIGSGPSGCYLAQSLLRAVPESEITVIDRLTSPYGLIRYGVAADHQHTKAITRQFERLFQAPNVRFAGNVEVGSDCTLDDLRDNFDVVVLASGLATDRMLGVPGDDLPGVFGAGTITRVLNGHPGERAELPDFGDEVVIIGAGNVALDILRFLVKDRTGYVASDVADGALDGYLAHPATHVTLVSRSNAAESKGDPQMLKELAALERARYHAPAGFDSGNVEFDRTQSARIAAFSEMTAAERPAYDGPTVDLRFGLTPVRVLGSNRVTGVEFTDGATAVTVPASSIITAIGFTAAGSGALAPLVSAAADTGRLEQGLYRTGWAKRGPQGAIPENRACAKAVADEIVADLAAEKLLVAQDKLGFAGLPEAAREQAVDYSQWLTLESYEREHAAADRVRSKITDHDRMVAIARGDA